MVPGLATIVGFLVCVEIASGILQGFYTPIFSDIAVHVPIRDGDVNWFEAAQLVVSALVTRSPVKDVAHRGRRQLPAFERFNAARVCPASLGTRCSQIGLVALIVGHSPLANGHEGLHVIE